MSAARRLTSSPVRRSAKKPGDSRRRWRNRSSRSRATTRSRGRQEVGLREVARRLQREQADEQQRDAVEQRAVVAYERGVEQAAHDLREREPHGGAGDEADGGDDEPPAVRPDERPQPRQRAGRRERLHNTARTSPAHTAAPTATCTAWSGRGSASSTIAAATATWSVTRATTPHAPRCLVRTAHHTEYPNSVYASSRWVQWMCCR